MSDLTVNVFNAVQPSNAYSPIYINLSDNSIDFSAVQFINAPIPICTKFLGIFTVSKLGHSANALNPISVTESGNVIDFKFVCSWNARAEMYVISPLKTTLVT